MTPSDTAPQPSRPRRENLRIELIAGDTTLLRLGLPARASVAASLSHLARRHLGLTLILLALVFALYGNHLIHGPPGFVASSESDLYAGAPWLGLAFITWLLGESAFEWTALSAGWRALDRAGKFRWLVRLLPSLCWLRALSLLLGAMSADGALPFLRETLLWSVAGAGIWLLNELAFRRAKPLSLPPPARILPRAGLRFAPSRSAITRRVCLLALATVSSLTVWENTGGNSVQPPIIALWIASGLLWSLFFASAGFSVFEALTVAIDHLRRLRSRMNTWVMLAFALIMLLGAAFRFAHLDVAPLEMMNSDHSVDIYAAFQVSQGDFMIMVPHWHMQEALHIYLIAALAALPSLDLDFYTVKLLSAIESLLTLPLVFWAGYELAGRRERKLALALALLIMGLVAVSYWHNVTTRYAQRTHLLVVFSALTLVFLARAMRTNRRADYILLGLTLGYGMYAYTACRMLPLVVVAGVGLAVLLRSIRWRERLRYVCNLGVCAFIAAVVSLPIFHVSRDYPHRFYTNNTGPVFGLAPAEPIDIDIDWFVTGIMRNFRRTLLMFNWNGDANWLQSAPVQPALDLLTGALLILGAAAWFARLLRSPSDPLLWLVPALIFIMLLPVALSVYDWVTVPSNTRAAGTMPGIYLLVGLAMLRMAQEFWRVFGRRLGVALAVGFCALVLLVSNAANTAMVFDGYARNAIQAPYSHIGKTVRALLDSDVGWGNIVFVPFESNWAMHNIFIEAGKPGWHYYTMLEDVPAYLEGAPFLTGERRLDPSRDLVFIYPSAHEEASVQLRQWYPAGREAAIHSHFPLDHALRTYMLYRVPAGRYQLN